jgi:DNA-binding NtrC family response regulator
MSDFNLNVDYSESNEDETISSFSEADTSRKEEQEGEKQVINEFFTADEIPSLEKSEQFLIEQSLKKFEGNRRKASEALGISERTLYRKLDQYGLD